MPAQALQSARPFRAAEQRKIGTYDLSVEPHDDCCSYLLPKRVETRADLDRVREAQDAMGEQLDLLEREALETAELRTIKPPWSRAAGQPLPS